MLIFLVLDMFIIYYNYYLFMYVHLFKRGFFPNYRNKSFLGTAILIGFSTLYMLCIILYQLMPKSSSKILLTLGFKGFYLTNSQQIVNLLVIVISLLFQQKIFADITNKWRYIRADARNYENIIFTGNKFKSNYVCQHRIARIRHKPISGQVRTSLGAPLLANFNHLFLTIRLLASK